ncbi:ADP-ribosylglycohydrolase family protein [Catellatospora vulcania]|uniref:ADP-ribosylglycohydrolase family protein n=1 Tax=Catellatospora vulcania TaxID=1460450 RepID=UPI0012D3FDC4|nr:ADP-ribosylglycohydrolase family protein [Catellatospora vulcania]
MPRVMVMDAASGSLFGLAYGDALGKPTEFRRYAEITADYGPGGPRELPEPALVTDDTQMALAVAWALRDAPEPSAAVLEPLLRERFLAWAQSPDNNRAPGMTCLNACANLSQGLRWQEATVAGSKGCGANMRVTPVGLIAGYDLDTLAGVAQLQAGLTHGHPTGLAAAELTALAVRLPRDGLDLADVPGALRDRCADQRTVYREDWLGDLWQRPGVVTPEEFIARGWDECADALDLLLAALARPDSGGDVCRETGEGWIAEEALATALLAALRHADDPLAALGRAAATSGDSDSIACLAGAFHGAATGMSSWPADWAGRIEYADQLAMLGAAWD